MRTVKLHQVEEVSPIQTRLALPTLQRLILAKMTAFPGEHRGGIKTV